ncbi:MAG: glycerol acyltransferase, partial [Solirubrobacteraceae bacterium]
HLHRLLRIDVAPVQIAPPWGVTVLDLPGRLPLPAKISIEVLPPIDLREELGGACRDTHKGYKLVTGRMQDALSALDQARALPLIG